MNNLVDSGLNLKTIEVRNLHKIVSDLNYNFTQLLQLPGFKGVTGADGASITGAAGQRGNNWIFADSTKFVTEYSTIVNSGQVTLSFLNSQVTSDLSKLLTTLGISLLVNNDVIVLPSRDVIQFSSSTNQFITTGIRFADGLSLTEDEVKVIVNNILGGLSNTDVYGIYKGVFKNYADNSAGLNNQQNTNSVLDIPVSGAGIGLDTNDFIFTVLKEANINPTVKNMLLTGSPKLYHDLVQNTLKNKTADYMAGFDDFGALAVMQNSYENGILIGHKNANDFSTWGRIYRTENHLRLLSDYDPRTELVGRIDLGKESTDLYSPKNLSLLVREGYLRLRDYNNSRDWLNADSSRMVLGDVNLPYVSITNKDYVKIFSKVNSNTALLGLVNNELKESLYQPKSDSIVDDSKKLLTHNLFFNFNQLYNQFVDSISNRVQNLENAKVYKQQSKYTGTINANSIIKYGTHLIRRVSSNTHSNFPNNYVQEGFSNWGIFKVDRFDDGDYIVIEQKYTCKKAGKNNAITSTRRGVSNDNGSTFTWSDWNNLLDSSNFVFKNGDKIKLNRNSFDNEFEIVFNHESHGKTKVEIDNSDVDSRKVSVGVKMDDTGHPIEVIEKDLNEWYYDKEEIDNKLKTGLPEGVIFMWGGNVNEIPNGFALCDGSNGTKDLRSRFIVGYDPRDSDYSTVGAIGGEKEHKLTIEEMPQHNHSGLTSTSGNHRHGFPYENPRGVNSNAGSEDGKSTFSTGQTDYAGAHFHTIPNQGGGKAHENRPPYFVLCFIQFVGFGVPRILSPTSTFTTTVGSSVTITPTVSGNVSTWSASNLPSGLTINSSTGKITGIPTIPVSNDVTLVATNDNGSSTPFIFTIIVNASLGTAPVINSASLIDVVAGDIVSYQITASGNPTAYAVQGLPPYLSVNTTTGLITGEIPLNISQSVVNFNLAAINAAGTGNLSVTMIVSSTSGSLGAPSLFSGGVRKYNVGQSVSYLHLNAGGVATNWSATGLPPNLSINANTGEVSGTISSNAFDSFYNVSVTAINAAGSSTANYDISIYGSGGIGDVRFL